MLYNYEQNDPPPPPEFLLRLAELEKEAPEHSFIARHPSAKPKKAVERMIPVKGWAHAGEAEAYEEVPKGWQEWIPTECRDDHAFAVRLEGDSMEREFRESDLIVVMPSAKAYSGCFVVCRFANDGILFRRFETDGERITLVPLNERYDTTHHAKEEFSWIYPVWGRWSQLWKGSL